MLCIVGAQLRGLRGAFVLFSWPLLTRKKNIEIQAMRKQPSLNTDRYFIQTAQLLKTNLTIFNGNCPVQQKTITTGLLSTDFLLKRKPNFSSQITFTFHYALPLSYVTNSIEVLTEKYICRNTTAKKVLLSPESLGTLCA